MKYICIFCGSSDIGAEKYAPEIKALCTALVGQGYGVVFGGSNVGLMKLVSDNIVELGGKIIGVITPELRKMGVMYQGIRLYEEETYSGRKAKTAELSSGFIALPGGFGTLDEVTEVAINNQFASYSPSPTNPKPLALLNSDGFYDGFLQQMQRCNAEKFITEKHRNMIFATSNVNDLVEYFNKYTTPKPDNTRWWEKITTVDPVPELKSFGLR